MTKPRVRLHARSAEQAEAMRLTRENARYLPGITLPDAVEVTADIADAGHADIVFVATPAAALAEVARSLAAAGFKGPLCWLAKGFIEDASGPVLPHQCLASFWPSALAIASGPSFAEEVALPTGACTHLAVSNLFGKLLPTW